MSWIKISLCSPYKCTSVPPPAASDVAIVYDYELDQKYVLRELSSSPVPASCCNALLDSFRKSSMMHCLIPFASLEIYTDEHEKLLGHTEKSWTLFVDGCGKDVSGRWSSGTIKKIWLRVFQEIAN
ncbi:uncharacterized protein LOC126784621 [Argentina anserina]|uniref:uncharacterized protein LOC126784621 n=1 Tax=Argentina anserina TaxID=57926 RepID=UPI0021762C89|nr:uncharacterized protein LOC126784621 [Potentilla anserina]